MSQTRTMLGGVAMMALFSVAATAEERVLTLDPEATQIHFTLGATLHEVEGTARLERGEIRFDPETGAASGKVIVRAASAETGGGGRDRDMHAKVLESERFTEISFTPQHVEGDLADVLEGTDLLEGAEAREGSAPAELEVSGSFEIHGTSHPLTLRVTAVGHGEDSEVTDLEVTLTFQVPYVAWGMKDPSKFVLRVAKEVEVRVETRGRLERVHAENMAEEKTADEKPADERTPTG